MISQIRVQNFKCLVDVTVDLGPFTVFIGPNDSGKTSLLDAIHMVGKTTRESLRNIFKGSDSVENLVWYHQSDRSLCWHLTGQVGPNEFRYTLTIPADGLLPFESLQSPVAGIQPDRNQAAQKNRNFVAHTYHPGGKTQANATLDATAFSQLVKLGDPFRAIANSFSSSEKYHLAAEEMHRPSPVKPQTELAPDGSNLSAVIDALASSTDRSNIINVETYLHDVIPTLSGIGLIVTAQNEKSIEFALSGNGVQKQTIPAALASEGALLLTAFLALAYGPTPEILLIEEPENGLHPSRLKQVIELLRKMSRGEVGNRPRQVLITTHSPILLNYVDPSEVRILQRDPEKGTQVTPMDKVPNIDRIIENFATGELWYLLGEEKLVQGVAE